MEETYLSHLAEWQARKLIHCTSNVNLSLPPDYKLLKGKDCIFCFDMAFWSLRCTLANIVNCEKCFQKMKSNFKR